MTAVTNDFALVRRTSVALWRLRDSIHRLLHLPLVGLVQDRAQDLLDPHDHLLARYLNRGGTAATSSGRRRGLLSRHAVPSLGGVIKGERSGLPPYL